MEKEAFDFAVAATTAVPFGTTNFPGGIANGVFVTATLSSGVTLTLANGTTIALGNQTLGTYLRYRCTMATFAAGTCVAYL